MNSKGYSLLLCLLLSCFVPSKADDIYKSIKAGSLQAALDYASANATKESLDPVLAYAAKHNQEEICQHLLDFKSSTDFHAAYIATLKFKKVEKVGLSPTEALLLKWCMVKSGSWAVQVSKIDRVNRDYQGFDQLAQRVSEVEHSMRSQGYTTFYHARNWEWSFVKDIWNLICAITHNQDLDVSRVMLRFRGQDVDVDELHQFRKELIEDGLPYGVSSCTHMSGKETEVVYMNRTPLSNVHHWGECSGRYFLQDHSVTGSKSAWDFAVEMLESYDFHAFIGQARKLYEMHRALTQHGELIAISVKNSHLDNLIYPARPAGYKYYSMWMNKTSEIVQALEQKVLDETQGFLDDGYDNECILYCFAVPNIPGDNDDMYIMRSIHLSDPVEYQGYQKQLQSLYEYVKDHKDKIRKKEVQIVELPNGGDHVVKKKDKDGLFGFLGLPWLGL